MIDFSEAYKILRARKHTGHASFLAGASAWNKEKDRPTEPIALAGWIDAQEKWSKTLLAKYMPEDDTFHGMHGVKPTK